MAESGLRRFDGQSYEISYAIGKPQEVRPLGEETVPPRAAAPSALLPSRAAGGVLEVGLPLRSAIAAEGAHVQTVSGMKPASKIEER